MPCPHCQAKTGPTDLFCFSCGARLAPTAAKSVAGGSAAASSPDPASAGSASLPAAAGGSRALRLVLVVLLNAVLLAASAWLVYQLLARYRRPATADAAAVRLGEPRVVRAAPRPPPGRPGPAPAASPPTSSAPPRADAANARRPARPARPGVAATVPASRPASQPALRPRAKAPVAAAAEGSAEQLSAKLDAGSVRMVVRHHLPQVRACYDRALRQQDGLGGTVEVEFAVSATDGRVRQSRVYSNSTGHAGLGRCLAVVIKGWRFPRPVGGDTTFVYPFVFSAGGG